jgi:uncharacterized membrane protein
MPPLIKRPRIESFSDLVFGLALSIGALALIGRPIPASGAEGTVVQDIVTFGYSFVILTTVWVRYTDVATSLPAESPPPMRLNLAMLLLVAIEPYLFNLVFASTPGYLSNPLSSFGQFVSAIFGIDLGLLFAILAVFDHIVLHPGEATLTPERERNFRAYRTRHIIAASSFLASALPWFGPVILSSDLSLTAREALWIIPLVVGSAWQRTDWILGRRTQSRTGEPSPPPGPAPPQEPSDPK